MPSAVSWTLVALACLLVGSHSAPTDSPDLVVTTGVSLAPAGPPTASTAPNPSDNIAPEVTEGPLAPLKVSSMNVTSVIALRYAHTTVLTKMKNPAKKSQEATFSIILPETAFITGFVMTLDGVPYTAYIKEKEEAKNIYTEAVNQGLGAAHIATKARDSNHFTVSVNVEPSTEALFNLTYEELLTRRLDVYNHVVNLNPGRLVPDLTVNIFIKEGRKITTLRVPELRTGNEVDAQESDRANEFAKIERNSDNTEAYIKFAPNLEQQEALMQVYAAKSKKSSADVSWSPTEAPSTEGVLGQFVVQYDVERDPSNGEILVNDGYFVHFFSPTDLKPLNKHVIFVLDTSSSMIGRKIEQLKEAMTSILSELKPGDYFNIMEFNSYVKVFDLENLEQSPVFGLKYHYYQAVTPATDVQSAITTTAKPADIVLPPPSPATPENIEKAEEVIGHLQAIGVTNIYDALDVSVKLAKAGLSRTNATSDNLPNTDLAPKQDAGTDVEKPDPIIIFLTDGQPTVGETNVEVILDDISELNSGPDQTPIFALAFGNGADRNFLRKLSIRNSGFVRHIYEAADAAQQLQHFYRQVADPLLSHVRFTYPANQIDEASVTKHNFRNLFAGTELVVAGKLVSKDVEQVTPAVTAVSSVGPIDFNSKPSTPVKEDKIFRPLERLWVYLHIKQLLDQKDASDKAIEGDKPETENRKKPEKEALELALQYSFVTPLTSLVVVKPNDTAAVNAESLDKSEILDVAGPPSLISGGGYSGLAPASNRRPVFLYGLTTPFILYTSTNPPTRLDDYDPLKFPWLEQYLVPSADSVNLPVNGTIINLKWFDGIPPAFGSGDETACTNSLTAGSAGTCKHLAECEAAKDIASLDVFLQHRCEREGYVAVCCPAQS